MQRIPSSMKAFNLRIMDLTEARLKNLRPITSLEIRVPSTDNFHPEGLFSTEIFGRVGTEQRDSVFAYIDVHIPILHPFIFETLKKLKGIYPSIMMGKTFAKWNAKEKNFEQSDELNGSTGYDFFMQHFPEMDFTPDGTDMRAMRNKLVQENRNKCLYSKIIVLPAGLRDAEVGEDGRIADNEINDYYRRLLSIAGTIPKGAKGAIYDRSRAALQITWNNLFNVYISMLEGKKKLIQGKLNYRTIHNGTRNVITAMDTSVKELGRPNNVNINTTMIGLFQSAKGLQPVVIYNLRHGILSRCFSAGVPGQALLINRKTLKQETVQISSKEYNLWATSEGMEAFINKFVYRDTRTRPLVIADHYVALVYLDENVDGDYGCYKVFFDIDELPPHFSKSKVAPITSAELLLLSMGTRWRDYTLTVTRYPVTGDGSIYPSIPYLKTTLLSDPRRPLNDNWELNKDDSEIIQEYPRLRGVPEDQIQFIETMAPHTSRHAGLGADHDGDMTNGNFSYDDYANKKTRDVMNTRNFFINADNTLRNSPIDDVALLAILNMG